MYGERRKNIQYGLKLHQPWADEIVKGNISVLMKNFHTLKRERIAIIAMKSIIREDLELMSMDEIQYYFSTFGYAIGSVVIQDIIRVPTKKIYSHLKNQQLLDEARVFPQYFTFDPSRKFVYFWMLTSPKKWINTIPSNDVGRNLIRVNIQEHTKG